MAIAAAFLTAGLAAAGPATAAERPIYFGAGAAVQSLVGGEDGLATVVKGGAMLDGAAPGLGVEGEFTRSLIDPEAGRGRDVTFTTLGGYLVYAVPFPDRRVSLRARLGLLWKEVEPEGGNDDTDLEISWGVGGEYRITNELSAFIEHTRIDSSLNQLSGGLMVRF